MANELGFALLELKAITNQLAMVSNVFPMTPGDGKITPTEDLKFLLSQMMVIKLSCFLEVKGEVEGRIARHADGTDLLRRLSPIIKRLNQSRESIKAYRNTLVAHGQSKADVRHPWERIVRHHMPVAYAEHLFLGRLAYELMKELEGAYQQQIGAAMDHLRRRDAELQPLIAVREAAGSIRSLDDVDREVQAVLAQIRS